MKPAIVGGRGEGGQIRFLIDVPATMPEGRQLHCAAELVLSRQLCYKIFKRLELRRSACRWFRRAETCWDNQMTEAPGVRYLSAPFPPLVG
jgi:hypothetical protein